ncbi:hypothetical protein LXL04_020110 [Taraxacum kok-saghyz]
MFNILDWWKVYSPKFPILSLMATYLFSIPSQTNSGRILDLYRSSLTGNMSQILICTQNWLRGGISDNLGCEEDWDALEDLEKFTTYRRGQTCQLVSSLIAAGILQNTNITRQIFRFFLFPSTHIIHQFITIAIAFAIVIAIAIAIAIAIVIADFPFHTMRCQVHLSEIFSPYAVAKKYGGFSFDGDVHTIGSKFIDIIKSIY